MPTRLGRALQNLSVQVTSKASRGSLSSYVVNAPAQYGQPLPMQADAYGLITPQRMREVAFKTPTAASCLNAILDFAVGVKPKLRNRDASKPVPDTEAALVKSLLNAPNHQETWRRFSRKLMRDLIRYGYAGVEIEPNSAGGVANLYVLDGSTLRVDFDEHGTITGYDQIDAHGQPIRGKDGVHGWEPQEVIWFSLDPDSNTAYGTSRISEMFVLGVIESLMLSYVGGRFTESNVPFGVMDIGDVSQDEIDYAVERWNDQVRKSGQHRLIITGSKGGAKWIPFHQSLKDLDAPQVFITVRSMIMGVFGVTANELGESQDINKANGYNLSFVFKHRALKPLLDEVYDTFTEFLLSRAMHLPDLELGYEEIDSRDDLLQTQIDELQLKSGVTSINAVRNRQGMPSVAGGEECYLFSGSSWIPVSMLQQFAEEQLRSLQMVNLDMLTQIQAMQTGGDGTTAPKAQPGKVKPPIIRTAQLPEETHTPDARGSSTPRITVPRVSINPPGQTGQKRTRGAVETNRAQGLRKEDMTR